MSTGQPGVPADHKGPEGDPFQIVSRNVKACIQCGTCTGSCASSAGMDLTPRQVWRMAQMGLKDDLFNSKTFWLCSACYFCTLRCPRGLPLTENMAALKRAATAENRYKDKRGPTFYRSFLKTVRKYGRVREAELMARYFLGMKNPAVPIGFTGLGIKLMLKGKIAPRIPGFGGEGKLEKLFRKVEELESGS